MLDGDNVENVVDRYNVGNVVIEIMWENVVDRNNVEKCGRSR